MGLPFFEVWFYKFLKLTKSAQVHDGKEMLSTLEFFYTPNRRLLLHYQIRAKKLIKQLTQFLPHFECFSYQFLEKTVADLKKNLHYL